MIPEVSLVLPLFIIASSLQLINKPIVLIMTYMSFALPYAIWLMAAFFQTVPVELEEAARLDGCTRLGILFRVVMPDLGAGADLHGDVRFPAGVGRILLRADLHQHAGRQDGPGGDLPSLSAATW